MKKGLSILTVVLLTLALFVGCTNNDNGSGSTGSGSGSAGTGEEGYKIALITDIGTIDDKSFNQGAWEGVAAYGSEHNVTYKYYKPSEKSTAEYLNSIDLAVQGGAEIVVTPGFLFEPAVLEAQAKYPEVKFILLDGFPNNQDYEGTYVEELTDNTYSVFYAEEQAGFLAGYAAVYDGNTKLGFMGGMAVPAVIKFGYGFVQGAEYAAKELGITGLEVKYHYTGKFEATPEAQAMAASWYQDGTEVIFACGGAVGNSVMAAAEAAGAKVIGVDVDQSAESNTVITSAIKGLKSSVYDAIEAFYNGSFPGGQSVTLGADVDGVGLPQDFSRFETFDQVAYDAIYAKLVSGEVVVIKNETEAGETVNVKDLPFTSGTVIEVE